MLWASPTRARASARSAAVGSAAQSHAAQRPARKILTYCPAGGHARTSAPERAPERGAGDATLPRASLRAPPQPQRHHLVSGRRPRRRGWPGNWEYPTFSAIVFGSIPHYCQMPRLRLTIAPAWLCLWCHLPCPRTLPEDRCTAPVGRQPRRVVLAAAADHTWLGACTAGTGVRKGNRSSSWAWRRTSCLSPAACSRWGAAVGDMRRLAAAASGGAEPQRVTVRGCGVRGGGGGEESG